MPAFTSYQDIVSDFRDQIEGGLLEHGARVPSMQVFADEHGVGKTMVQRAYNELRRQGYLETIAGKGTFVSWVHADKDDPSPSCRAFWSYAQLDDQRSHGGVTQLLEHIKDEYAMCTSVELDVFKDKDRIDGGDDWQRRIDEGIAVSTLFIAVVTPTYLSRPACVEEFKTALDKRRRNEITAVLPLEYVDITEALQTLHDDEMANALAETQRVNVQDLRFRDSASPEYRRAVHQIVERLMKDEGAGDADLDEQTQRLAELEDDDPTLLEALTLVDENMPLLMECVESASDAMGEVNTVMNAGNQKLDKGRKNRTLASNVLVVKTTAKQLEEPSQRFCDHANAFDTTIRQMDHGIQGLHDFYLDSPTDSELRLSFQENADALAVMVNSTHTAFGQMAAFKKAISQFKRLSKDLRRPCAALEHGVDLFTGSEDTFTRWERLFRELAQAPQEDSGE